MTDQTVMHDQRRELMEQFHTNGTVNQTKLVRLIDTLCGIVYDRMQNEAIGLGKIGDISPNPSAYSDVQLLSNLCQQKAEHIANLDDTLWRKCGEYDGAMVRISELEERCRRAEARDDGHTHTVTALQGQVADLIKAVKYRTEGEQRAKDDVRRLERAIRHIMTVSYSPKSVELAVGSALNGKDFI